MDKLQYADVCNAEYWRALCPNLQVCSGQGSATQASQDAPGKIRKRLDEDGYTMLSGASKWPVNLRSIEQGINKMVAAGWPASFIMMFDEPWLLMHSMAPLMLEETGNAPNMDMLAWRVDAAKGEAGFAPHRDRQPDSSPASFRQDKSAKYTSCWLAITDANPDTSCLYVIPRNQDPGYFRGDPEEPEAPDPLHAALPCKEAFQHVRALPCASGEAVVFTHRIIHWGSAGTQHARHPRISLSFGFSEDAYEAPYFDRAHLPLPPLHLRLALVSAQMLTYYQRFPPSASLLTLYKAAVDESTADLEPEYRRKVLAHFVRAARELHEGAGNGPSQVPEDQPAATQAVAGSSGAADPAGDSAPDDVVDAAMEAMLDAELEGRNEFEDDFDEIASAGGEMEIGMGENNTSDVEEENEGENDEELPVQGRASNDVEPAPSSAHAAAAAHVQAQPNAVGEAQDDGGTPRGSENAAQHHGQAFRPLAERAGAGDVGVVPVAPARMAAGNGGVLRVDSQSMRSAGGEESTVLCAMDAFDEASLGEACTSRAAPWDIGGVLAWGKKRKR